jgi:hypothetical protein
VYYPFGQVPVFVITRLFGKNRKEKGFLKGNWSHAKAISLKKFGSGFTQERRILQKVFLSAAEPAVELSRIRFFCVHLRPISL